MTVKKAKREKSTTTKGHYLPNSELLASILEARAAGKLTDRLAKNLHMLAERYSFSASWVHYSFREDMVATAALNLYANWHKFDPEKGDNPFSFFTTAVFRSFLSVLADEKKQRDIRDELLIEQGANPSFSYQPSKTSDDTAFRSNFSDD
jgi:hypothetical protein